MELAAKLLLAEQIWIGQIGNMNISTQGYYRQGQQLSHRKIVGIYIGRKLSSDQIVHHKNGFKFDNRIENLTVVTRSKHAQLHHFKNPIINGEKRCSTCKEKKLLAGFSKRNMMGILGYRSACKKCEKLRRRKYFERTGN